MAQAAADSTVEGLRDVFRCFICMEKLEDARLCPQCSKFCCFRCIRRWLTEQRPQCPHCRCSLRVGDLVKCGWAEEVTHRLDTLESSSVAAPPSTDAQNACNIHQEKLSVFCWTCQACICHHCALWGGNHSGHTLKPLEDEYNHRVGQISQEVRKLRRRLCLLISTLQDLERNMERIREKKEDRVREMRCAVEMMMARLDAAMKEKLVSLGGQKRSLSMEVEMVEGILSEVEHQLASASHSVLVKSSTELFRMLAQIQRADPPTPAVIPAEFDSEMVPDFENCIFVIQPYSELREKAEPVYSPELKVNGLTWRLKVYPDGNGVVRGNYLSVFLELTQGPPGQAKYDYRVEMCQQKPHRNTGRSTGNVLREFASDFEAGECWGYNRFYKIDYLEREGYLDLDDDSLVMQFQVRPMGYYQKSKDMAWQIEELEAKQARSELEMNELKERLTEALNAAETTQTPRGSSGAAVRAGDVDESGSDENLPPSRRQDPFLSLLGQISRPERPGHLVDTAEQEPEEDQITTQAESVRAAKSRLNSVVQESENEPELDGLNGSGSLNMFHLLESDVEVDGQHGTESAENDVEDEFAAVGGIREALEELNLSFPDREDSDLLGNWPARHTDTMPHNSAPRRASTGTRLREAFRFLEGGEGEGWVVPPMNSRGGTHLQCPACSPQKRSIYRKVKSRHQNVLRDEGFLVGGREERRGVPNSRESSVEEEQPRHSGMSTAPGPMVNVGEDFMNPEVSTRSSSMDVLCGGFIEEDQSQSLNN